MMKLFLLQLEDGLPFVKKPLSDRSIQRNEDHFRLDERTSKRSSASSR